MNNYYDDPMGEYAYTHGVLGEADAITNQLNTEKAVQSLYNQGFKPYDANANTNYNRLLREGKLGNQRTTPAPIEDRSTDADLTDPLINGLVQPESVYNNPAVTVIPNFAEMDGTDAISMAYAFNSNMSDTIPLVYDTIEKQIGKERAQKAIRKVAPNYNERKPKANTTRQVNTILEKVAPKEQPTNPNAKRVISYEGLEPTMAQLETMRVANPNLYNKIGMANGTTGVSSRYPLFSTSNPLTMVNEQIASNNKENLLPIKMDPYDRIKMQNDANAEILKNALK